MRDKPSLAILCRTFVSSEGRFWALTRNALSIPLRPIVFQHDAAIRTCDMSGGRVFGHRGDLDRCVAAIDAQLVDEAYDDEPREKRQRHDTDDDHDAAEDTAGSRRRDHVAIADRG